MITWLNSDLSLSTLEALTRKISESLENSKSKCICCHAEDSFSLVHTYDKKPEGETDFSFPNYYREIKRCTQCGHFISKTPLDPGVPCTSSDYVDRTYGGMKGIQRKFHQVMSLRPEQFDNFGRVEKIIEYAKNSISPAFQISLYWMSGEV